MNILCYCEANSKTGFGHFSRVSVLIKIIKKKYPKSNIFIFSQNKKEAKLFFKTTTVYSKNIYKYILKKKNYFNLIILDPPYYEKKNNSELNERLKKIYFIKNKKFKVLKLTDETKPNIHYCDYLINDYPLAKNFIKKYKITNKKIKLFLGIYAFLYPEIIIKKLVKKDKKYDLLIAFGGKDPKNLAQKYFYILRKLKIKKIFILNKKSYKKFFRLNNNLNTIKPITSQNNFINYLGSSKMYLSTPSNIMFEAFALGVPGTVIATQNRQKIMGNTFSKMQNVKSLGLFKKINKDTLNIEFKTNKNRNTKFNLKLARQMQQSIVNNLK